MEVKYSIWVMLYYYYNYLIFLNHFILWCFLMFQQHNEIYMIQFQWSLSSDIWLHLYQQDNVVLHNMYLHVIQFCMNDGFILPPKGSKCILNYVLSFILVECNWWDLLIVLSKMWCLSVIKIPPQTICQCSIHHCKYTNSYVYSL